MKEFLKTKLGMTIVAALVAAVGTFVTAYCPPCEDVWLSMTGRLTHIEAPVTPAP